MTRFDPLTGRVITSSSIPSVQKVSDPSPTDVGFPVPYLWVNDITNDVFILTSVDAGIATWKPLTAPGGGTQGSVIAFVNPVNPPPTENTDDKYILSDVVGVVHPDWDGAQKNSIVTFNGTVWVETVPVAGTSVFVQSISTLMVFNSSWVSISTLLSDASTTSKGVAEFDPLDFDVTAGVVTLDAALVKMLTVVVAASSVSGVINSEYICQNAGLTTITLPVTAQVGQRIRILGTTAGGFKVIPNPGQQIRFGISLSTLNTGYVQSYDPGDEITLVCVTADTGWQISQSLGNLEIA